jgi:hypothetical protein
MAGGKECAGRGGRGGRRGSEATRQELVGVAFSKTRFFRRCSCVSGLQSSVGRFVPQFVKPRKAVTRNAEVKEEDPEIPATSLVRP